MTAHDRLRQIAAIADTAPVLDGTESWHELLSTCRAALDLLAECGHIAKEYDLILGAEDVDLAPAIKRTNRLLFRLQERYKTETGRELCL